MPVADFFEGLPAAQSEIRTTNEQMAQLQQFLGSQEGQAVMNLFARIDSARRRRAVLGMMRAMTELELP
jgi:hypothetical protein